jgi:hypothetical protein
MLLCQDFAVLSDDELHKIGFFALTFGPIALVARIKVLVFSL